MNADDYWLAVRPFFWALLIVAVFLFAITGELPI